MSIAGQLEKVMARIREAEQRFGRTVGETQLLAVSKFKPAEDVLAAYRAGQQCFGENRMQEALEKQARLTECDITWYFIGGLQSNKAKKVAAEFDWVLSLDNEKCAKYLDESAKAHSKKLNVCIQLNIDETSNKGGVFRDQLHRFATKVSHLEALSLRGLMVIPEPRETQSEQREVFREVKQVFDALKTQFTEVDTLSMGMSADLEAAVAEGATMVRIGTDIFGART